MTFNSIQYFLFLPVVYLAFYFANDRFRWVILLAASFLFYAALKAPYLLGVLLLVATATYAFGNWLDRAGTPRAKHRLLLAGIVFNVLILGVMKYLPSRVFVAIGVSFYVFQAISYLIDIYLEVAKPERHFGYFLLYLSFFPKLLQGPIERAGNLLPQLKRPYVFDYDNVRAGMLIFAWGLFKKVVVADRLGVFVDAVYNDCYRYTGLPLLIATYLYAFQVYFDFSAYTDMALGTARIFNIRLTQNFNSPYLAISIADFWRRWHISFSRWILDYIFRPLQMSWRDRGALGTALALIITFLVSGIWHGAAWGFVIWGLLHGCYLAASVYYRPFKKRIHNWLGVGRSRWLRVWQVWITFNLVCFAWIFFRANSFSDAIYVVTRLLTYFRKIPSVMFNRVFLNEDVVFYLSSGGFLLVIAGLLVMALSGYVLSACNKAGMDEYIFERPAVIRWVFYVWVTMAIIVFGFIADSSFIYYRF